MCGFWAAESSGDSAEVEGGAGAEQTPQPVRTWHHHTAAVARLAVGAAPQEGAWADVVLSLGEDGTVGLISLCTLQVERCVYTPQPGLPLLQRYNSMSDSTDHDTTPSTPFARQ